MNAGKAQASSRKIQSIEKLCSAQSFHFLGLLIYLFIFKKYKILLSILS